MKASQFVHFHKPPPVARATVDQPKMSASPVQNGRINKKKRGADRYVDGVTQREPEFMVSVRIARAVRTKMSKGEVTAANVRDASSLTLLRVRARNIRSVYERLWRCHIDGVKVPFLYNSKEGDGNDGY